jgi:hypothetical protein
VCGRTRHYLEDTKGDKQIREWLDRQYNCEKKKDKQLNIKHYTQTID